MSLKMRTDTVPSTSIDLIFIEFFSSIKKLTGTGTFKRRKGRSLLKSTVRLVLLPENLRAHLQLSV
jgi:hypothetical protein